MTTVSIALAVAIGWTATATFVWLETRRRWHNQLAELEHSATVTAAELAAVTAERDDLEHDRQQLTVALAAVELERDIRRDPNPIVAHLAHHGPATTDTLTAEFGPRVATKLLELMEAQEVTCDEHGRWRWQPPARRYGLTHPDPTETIEAPSWYAPVVTLSKLSTSNPIPNPSPHETSNPIGSGQVA